MMLLLLLLMVMVMVMVSSVPESISTTEFHIGTF
jgi:hypothetical protein